MSEHWFIVWTEGFEHTVGGQSAWCWKASWIAWQFAYCSLVVHRAIWLVLITHLLLRMWSTLCPLGFCSVCSIDAALSAFIFIGNWLASKFSISNFAISTGSSEPRRISRRDTSFCLGENNSKNCFAPQQLMRFIAFRTKLHFQLF